MPSPNIFVCAYFKEGACHAEREIHDPSSYDESSKTNSTCTIKSSGGNWTNWSVREGVHEVTHRCETI